MPKKSKNLYNKYNREVLIQAIEACRNGLAISRAAREYSIPRTTLSDHVNGRSTVERKAGRTRNIPEAVENDIVDEDITAAKSSFPVTKQQFLLKDMATGDDEWEPLSEADMKLLQARRERSDQISKRMGDYLLKGYKMLAITCPQCDTILLQTRQGQNYCVTCSELDSDADKDNPVLSQTAAMSMAREIELASAATATSTIKTDRASAASSPSPRHQPPPITPLDLDAQTHPAGTHRQRPLTARSDKDQDQASLDALGMTSIDVQSWPANSGDIPTRKSDTASARSGLKVDFGAGDGDPCVCSSSGNATGPQGQITINTLTDKVQWATLELRSAGCVEYSKQLCQLIKAASDACVSVRAARI